jgi:hypothetical protein
MGANALPGKPRSYERPGELLLCGKSLAKNFRVAKDKEAQGDPGRWAVSRSSYNNSCKLVPLEVLPGSVLTEYNQARQ